MECAGRFIDLNVDEAEIVNGGGLASAVAGGLAGALIGVYVGSGMALATGDSSCVGSSVVAFTTTGVWVGLGCPLLP